MSDVRPSERYRLPLVIGASVLVVLLGVGVILVSGLLAPRPQPSMTAPPPASLSTTVSPSASADSPEAAVRAFFDAYAQARRTDDPALVRPHVTSERSSAYRSVEGFLLGQKQAGKASVTTVLRIERPSVQLTADGASVRFTLVEGGYDIDLDTGEPRESPEVLPATTVTVELKRVGKRWLVERYEARP